MTAIETLSARTESRRASDRPELDRVVERVRASGPEFARLSPRARAQLLRACARGVAESGAAWAAAGNQAKGLPADAGEEWLVGPIPTLRNLRLLVDTLERLELSKPAIAPHRVRTRADGRVSAKVFPTDGFDTALFFGLTVEQLMMPSESERSVIEKAGRIHLGGYHEPGLSLVLGAGNVSSIPPMDALYKMFAEGYVCVVKMNPVNEWSGPFFEKAFAPLIERGYLAVVYGGADEGKYLVEHPLVDDVHITGSNHTHDLIVWGPAGAERDRRKADNDPVLTKRITSELGNVSPVAIVPHTYQDKELDFIAWNLAAMVTNNASFNCNAAKILVLSKGWSQKDELLKRFADKLRQVPTRKAYYPGAEDRYQALTDGRDRVEKIGDASEGKLPWTVVHGLDPSRTDDPAFSTEPFCALLSVTELKASEPAEFLSEATHFMNDTLWGTLNAMIVVPPQLERSAAVKKALDTAILDLRYGTVAINHWPALVYAVTSPTWGGHPSSTLQDIQSGLGWVHNTHLLENVEKAVLRGPLTIFPKPLWFPNNRVQASVAEKLLRLEADPSWLRVPGIGLTALRG